MPQIYDHVQGGTLQGYGWDLYNSGEG